MEKILDYQIVKELGDQTKRKFSRTFLAEKNHTKFIVKQFIKTIKNEHLVEQIQLESTFNFKTNGLPQVIDFISTDNEHVLILAYKKGITIDLYWNKLKRRKRIPFLTEFIGKLIPIFNQLEKEKIVHCDIKTSNILIEEVGEDFNVHLIDFGLAVKNNRPRGVIFPLGYAAPELVLNELSIIDSRTDQFSLGILIWRLFSGKLPLYHPNPSVYTNLQITHPLPEHSSIQKKVYLILKKMTHKHQFSLPPNRMDTSVVKQLLKEAMNERYSSLNEIKNDLEKIKPFFYQRRSRR